MYNVANSIITDRKMYRCIFKVSFYFRGSLNEINVLSTLFIQIEVSIMTYPGKSNKKSLTSCAHELFKLYNIYVPAVRCLNGECFNVNKDMPNEMIFSFLSSLAILVTRMKKCHL